MRSPLTPARVAPLLLVTTLLGLPAPAAAQDAPLTSPPPPADASAPLPGGRLADVFPTELGGQAWDGFTLNTGQEILDARDQNNPEDRTIEAFLEATGASIDDISVAQATLQTEDDAVAYVTAVQALGLDAERIWEHLFAPSFEASLVQPREEPGEFAGKVVRTIWDDEYPEAPAGHVYLGGDTVWVVIATEPLLTEVFESIP